jgi:hypothetical protein
MWWLRRRRPAFNTMAAVCKDHSPARQQVCRALTLVCPRREFVGPAWIAIDGRTFKAVNSQARHWGEKQRTRLLQQSNAQSKAARKELDDKDPFESQAKKPPADELNANREPLRSRPGQSPPVRETLHARHALQRSLTDAASRAMKTRHGIEVCDHVPVAVDANHPLLVAPEVTKAVTAQEQLATRAKPAQERLDPDH